jgi:hypothetical protein
LTDITTQQPAQGGPQNESAVASRGPGTVERSRRPLTTVILSVAAWSLLIDLVALASNRYINAQPHPGRSSLTAAWQQWDANWYLRIIQAGYHGFPTPVPGHGLVFLQAAFYPGFPLVAGGVYHALHPLGLSVTWAMLLTNQVLVFAMALLLYRLAVALTDSATEGVRTVHYLLLFPFAYFMLAPYSETLFLTCLAGFCWALVTRRYGVAALFGAAASGTRLVGVILPVIFIVGYLEQHDWQWRAIKLRTIVYALVPLAGAAAYAIYQWIIFGDPTYSQHASQLGWARSFTLNVWRVIRDSFHHQPLSAGYFHGVPFEAFVIWPLAIGFVVLSVTVWRKFSPALGLMCVLLMLESVTSGSMLSFNRYLLPLLPCFVVLAVWGRNALFDFVYRTAGALLLAMFLIMFVHGTWTG